MTNWTEGYVSEIGYTYGYYAELDPLRAQLALLNAGWVAPQVGTACELGFGQGLSGNIHAAASVVQWHGTDFNPSQAAYSQSLAKAAGTSAVWCDDAFAQYAQRADLPDFDYIGLHGIWSWINEENRQVLVDFIGRKLKPGGLLYVSYNTQPGWAAFGPMRHLLAEHVAVAGAPSVGLSQRIDEALAFAGRLMATQPIYAQANPQAGARLKSLGEQDRHYLAHEYFNRDWHPIHFAEMARWLAPAKMEYACSAHLLDHLDALHLAPEQLAFLAEIPDRMFREGVRDFMVNRPFRRDYWVKGLRRLDAQEQAEAWHGLRVMLCTPRADVRMKVAGSRGEAELSEAAYAPLLNLMADHQVRSVGQIASALAPQGIGFSQIKEAVLILVGSGQFAVAQAEASAARCRPACDRLNLELLKKSRCGGEVRFLASPLTGGGVPVPRLQQLFMLARRQGLRDAEAWVQFAWSKLSLQGQRLIQDGRSLDTPEENLALMRAEAQAFERQYLGILETLQMV